MKNIESRLDALEQRISDLEEMKPPLIHFVSRGQTLAEAKAEYEKEHGFPFDNDRGTILEIRRAIAA
ncbi:hypothetical protein [Nitrosomonas sp. Is37]|uniref:hypothetical protein n=1 Tax=Nitrosomonas sp. Is37 TaxID=3080535 RepID=UPI00294B8B37|nr:hypothetical protein [Nitrosomonas sp. Is37]MDV6345401.1 hypothetical protein [Nitrosomonas sp. Is37]